MSQWPSTKARRVLAALLGLGWVVKRQSGSHRTSSRAGWPDFVLAFYDGDEIGPKMPDAVAEMHNTMRQGVAVKLLAWQPSPR